MSQLSIIIPTYNRLESLKEVMPSYLKQKSVVEIIIVDDGSAQDIRGNLTDLIIRHPFIKVISLKKHSGLPAARNVGIKASKGEYILFGEDDVIFEDTYAEQLLQCSAKTQADIISGRYIPLGYGQDIKLALEMADSDADDFINDKLVFYRLWEKISSDRDVFFTHACSLIRREVFNRVLFSEKYKGNAIKEEVDFHVTARKNGFKIFFCPHTYIYHLNYNKTRTGGCHINLFSSTFFFLKNNYIFYNRHYSYLKREGFLKYNFVKLFFYILLDRITFLSRCLIRYNYQSVYGIRLKSSVANRRREIMKEMGSN